MHEAESSDVKTFIELLHFYSENETVICDDIKKKYKNISPRNLKVLFQILSYLSNLCVSVLQDIQAVNFDDDAKSLYKSLILLTNDLNSTKISCKELLDSIKNARSNIELIMCEKEAPSGKVFS